MRKELLLAIAAGVFMTTSCEQQTDVKIGDNNAPMVGEMMNINFKAGTPDTRVTIDPYEGMAALWSPNDEVDAYDLTDNFYEPGEAGADLPRLYTLMGLENPGTSNTNAFKGQMPVTNVTDNGDGTSSVLLDFFTLTPTQENLQKAFEQGKIPAASILELRSEGSLDYLKVNLPGHWAYNADVLQPASAMYKNYGEFAPHISAPISGRTIIINNATGESSVAPGEPDVVLDFMQLYHSAQVVIDASTINYESVGHIEAHQLVATITLPDGTTGNTFERTAEYRIWNITNNADTETALAGAKRTLTGEEARLAHTASMSINYFAGPNKVQVSPLTRQGDGTTITFPIITPPTLSAVGEFNLLIEFFDLTGKRVMHIEKNVTAPQQSIAWEVGQGSKIGITYANFALEDYGIPRVPPTNN